jgi:type IV pilus assembly protein PilB
MLDDAQLEKLLVQAGKIDATAIKDAKAYAAENKISFRDALVKKEIISDEEIGLVESTVYKTPFIVLTKLSLTTDVINIIPEHVAQKQQAVAFERNDKEVKVALADINNKNIVNVVAKKTGLPVTVYYATPQDIKNVVLMYRQDLQKKFEKLLYEGLGTKTQTTLKTDPPIEKIVNLLITSAYNEKASDIHLEPREGVALVRFRVDGILFDTLSFPIQIYDRIVTRIKVLSNLRTDEHLNAQDGKMQMSLKEENLNLRVSILPIADGEKIVMRLLSSKSRSYSLTDLGMNEKDLEKLTRAFNKPNGMILSTGPTGSGKTTSIYSIIKVINSREKNITTVEDPIEYKVEGANQVQVNMKTNLTFANGLRSILRQDPDYIFVGEIRDNETAGIAVNAALTGHLVFSTLHTNDAPSAIPRLIDMKVEPFLVASTVNVVVGQRLVRKICTDCRFPYAISKEELLKNFSEEDLNLFMGDKKEIQFYKGKGCPNCHFSGYRGRIGIFEVLEITKEIRKLISQKQDAEAILAAAKAEGMTTMLADGLEKIINGSTTMEEVLRATKVESG